MSLRSYTLVAGLAALSAQPHTEAATDRDLHAIDEIVVSVSRRDTTSGDIGAALSIVDGSEVARNKLISDALGDVPGVFVQQTTPGQSALIVRGQRGSSILHLVDGLRLNNAIFRNAPTQYFALVPTTAVERIETIRGTPTSLYGSDAVGGAVQVVTRVPSFDNSKATSRGNFYAGFDSAEAMRSVRATVDAGKDTLAGTISAEYLTTGNRKIAGGERIGPSGFESKAGRAALLFTPDEDHQWLVDVHYLIQPSTPRVDELVAGFGQDAPDSAEFFFEPNRRLFVHARRQRSNGAFGLDWRTSLSWQRIDDDRRTRNFGSDERRQERNRSDLAGLLVTAAGERESGSWLAGAEYYYDRVSSKRHETDITSSLTVIAVPRFPDGSTLAQAALFANANWQANDRNTITGGIRLTHVSTRLAATAVSQSARIKTTDLSGDAGWQYHLNDQWQLVANVGAGFRAPNIFDLGTLGNRPGNRFNVPNADLESERVLQADIGFRLRRDKLRLEGFVYALDYCDRIGSASTGETTADGRDIVRSVNAASSRVHGVETAVAIELGTKWHIEANALYTHGEQRMAGDSEAADRIPPLSGRIQLRHDTRDNLSTFAWLRFADQQNRLSSRDIRDPRIDPRGTPGWSTFGARLDWSFGDQTSVSLGVENLFDKRYRTHGSGIDAVGRNLFASVNHQW